MFSIVKVIRFVKRTASLFLGFVKNLRSFCKVRLETLVSEMASWYAVCNTRRDPHERSQDPQKAIGYLLRHCITGADAAQLRARAVDERTAGKRSGLRHLHVHDRGQRHRPGGCGIEPDHLYR